MLKNIKYCINIILNLYFRLNNKRKFHFKFIFFFAIFTSLLEVATLLSLFPFLSILLQQGSLEDFKLLLIIKEKFSLDDDSYLFLVTIIFLFFLILSSIFRLILLWGNIKLANAISKDFSLDLFKNKIHQNYLDFINSSTNEAISSITVKTTSLNRVLLAVNTIGTSFFLLISILFTISYLNPLISLSSFFLIFLIYFFLILNFNKVLSDNSFIISKEQTNIVKILQESFGIIRDMILKGNQAKYTKIFFHSINNLYNAEAKNSFISQSPRFFIETAGIIIIIIICSIVSFKSGSATSVLPLIGVLVLAAQKLIPLMQVIYTNFNILISNTGQLSDLEEFFNIKLNYSTKFQDDEKKDKSKNDIEFKNKIEFKDISFSYSKNNSKIFEKINFIIKKGEKIGIVGKTGEGKSTLLDVIMGLLSPTEGEIFVDNTLINSKNLKSWQKLISHVPQDLFLIDGTIYENITFSSYNKGDDKFIKKILSLAQLKDFVENLPMGIETIVGERGVKLSGGQKQRVAIARALFNNSKILVFDEATSALDDGTEQLIGISLDKLDKEFTTIMVAHRLTSIKKCDRIFELNNNQLKIFQSYDEYMARNP
jgi:ABC-type multidrug transport system fused ATPase/permease subunit